MRILPVLLAVSWSCTALAAESPWKLRAAVVAGQDNNATLDPAREGDFFMQESISADYKHLFNKRLQGRLGYDAFNVNYFDVTDQNALLQRGGIGLDTVIIPKRTILETEYAYNFVYFPRNDSVTFDEHEIRAGFRHRFTDAVLLRNAYTVSYQAFDTRKLRGADAVLSGDERQDTKQSIEHEVGFKFIERTYWKLSHEHIWSDSNDLFHDYYDYQADKYQISVAFTVIPKIQSFLKVAYERRAYEDRPLLNDPGTIEEDGIYTASLACFYKIRKDVSLGGIYTYREKTSNEPTQRYSGAISTLGLYYSF